MIDAASLESRLEGMHRALDLCPMEVSAALALPARAALDEVSERLALGVDHTVVALLGGTGSGKSSLFNALTSLDFADVGARRPTTSRAAACSWGGDAGPLLDFLGVSPQRRIRRESALDADDEVALAGLVLLDVPDYDSVTTEHALQVDRLVPLADILVWVVDPQKYADAALHEGYLRGLGARQEDMVVLVNQVDTLPDSGLDRLLVDVRGLLDADGLDRVRVLPVSALRGDNLTTLRDLLTGRVAQESNAARTASAALDAIALRLRPTVAAHAVAVEARRDATTTERLARAAGAVAVEDSIRTGLAHAMPRALARPEPPSRATVAAEETTWLRATAEGLPGAWLRSLEAAVVTPETLAAQTTEAVGSVPLPGHRRPVIELAWWGGLLAVLAGVVWAVVVLLTGGPHLAAAIGLAAVGLAAVGAAHVRRGARARAEAARYREQVDRLVAGIVERGLSQPAEAVLERHRVLQAALGL